MRRVPLTIVPRAGEATSVTPAGLDEASCLLSEEEGSALLRHTRITGRHGVFLLEQGKDGGSEVVDTRPERGIVCTCGEPDCDHVAILRACGFLLNAA